MVENKIFVESDSKSSEARSNNKNRNNDTLFQQKKEATNGKIKIFDTRIIVIRRFL